MSASTPPPRPTFPAVDLVELLSRGQPTNPISYFAEQHLSWFEQTDQNLRQMVVADLRRKILRMATADGYEVTHFGDVTETPASATRGTRITLSATAVEGPGRQIFGA